MDKLLVFLLFFYCFDEMKAQQDFSEEIPDSLFRATATLISQDTITGLEEAKKMARMDILAQAMRHHKQINPDDIIPLGDGPKIISSIVTVVAKNRYEVKVSMEVRKSDMKCLSKYFMR